MAGRFRGSRRKHQFSTAVPAMVLRDLRRAAGVTQVQMAALAKISQPEVSRYERGTDHMVSTLCRYVLALGGSLKIVVEMGGRKIVLIDKS